MKYEAYFTDEFKKQLKKLKKKDKLLLDRIKSKIKEILENPYHYKPLRNDLKGLRRVHVKSFILIFGLEKELVVFYYVKHHDDAYL